MSSKPRNRPLKIIDSALVSANIVKDACEGAPVLAPLKATAGILITILETIRSVKVNKEDWIRLGEHLSTQIKDMHDDLSHWSGPHSTELLVAANTYEQKLENILEKVLLTSSRRRFEAYLHSRTDKEEIVTLNRDVDNCWKDFMRKMIVQVHEAAHRIETGVKIVEEDVKNVEISLEAIGDTTYITKLAPLPSATGDDHNTCLNGTRTVVLDSIRQWANDPRTTQVCWLADVAGAGKSTIAKQLSSEWKAEGRLGACFFFDKNRPSSTSKQVFCDTIAAQMANNQPRLLPSIIDGIKAIGPVPTMCPFEEKLQKLVISPLKDVGVVLVIDALDECHERDRIIILRSLLSSLGQATRLKIFITSRPERDITELLSSYRSYTDSLHDIGLQSNQEDIAMFVKHEMRHLIRSSELTADEVIQLAKRVNCLFILASTACKTIQNSLSPRSRLQELMDPKQNSLHDINRLYLAILTKICGVGEDGEPADSGAPKEVIEVLQAVLAAATPLSISTIDALLGVKCTGRVVEFLASVLNVRHDGTVVILHPTFREFLEDRRVAGIFHIDVADAHGLMANGCLTTMKRELRFNICRLKSSFIRNKEVTDLQERVSRYISEQLQYGCVYWLSHFAESSRDFSDNVNGTDLQFVDSAFPLYWIEVLSAIEKIPKVLRDLQAVGTWCLSKIPKERLDDIKRFMIAFSTPISESIPHIYISSIPFAAERSHIREETKNLFPNTMSVSIGCSNVWPKPPQEWRGHTGTVFSVVFSPDGYRIVTGSSDNTIRMWDAETGQTLGEPLRGHTDCVRSVGFSPDGRRIVSGSYDHTIRLWDAETGESVGGPLRGHSDKIHSVAFSPDGHQIVSGSRDRTVRLWDTETGQVLGTPRQGHTSWVVSVAFSPDGRRIASGSLDNTIWLWDAKTDGAVGEQLHGHTGFVLSVAFSPDGHRIVSGSSDKTIRLWNAKTGQALGEPLRSHTDSVQSVAFSPSGHRILSGSADTTIKLWDTETGRTLGMPRQGHNSWVLSVAFSPNSHRIASGSLDNTIRLWDAKTGRALGEPLHGHIDSVQSVAFSPDGLRIVSCSEDNTIQLWNAQTGEPLGELLRCRIGHIGYVAFSPDGRRIIYATTDDTVRLWDAETGQALGTPIRGRSHYFWSIASSPDGRRMVSGGLDGVIRLWDAETSQEIGGQLHGHTGFVWSVAFSPDGRRVVSGSDDKTIRLWNAETGQPLGVRFRGNTSNVHSVAFSSDGRRIVSGSSDKTIRLWDAETGQPLGAPLHGHTGVVQSVAFAADGYRIVSGSSDNTVRLWNVEMGKVLGEPPRDHIHYARPLPFHLDDRQTVPKSDNTATLSQGSDINQSLGLEPHPNTRLVSAIGSPLGSVSSKVPSPRSHDLHPGMHLLHLHAGSHFAPPGFDDCSLSEDGWVTSSNRLLYWVPPNNRHGLKYPHILSLPTNSPLRSTWIDFSNFRCGTEWSECRK